MSVFEDEKQEQEQNETFERARCGFDRIEPFGRSGWKCLECRSTFDACTEAINHAYEAHGRVGDARSRMEALRQKERASGGEC